MVALTLANMENRRRRNGDIAGAGAATPLTLVGLMVAEAALLAAGAAFLGYLAAAGFALSAHMIFLSDFGFVLHLPPLTDGVMTGVYLVPAAVLANLFAIFRIYRAAGRHYGAKMMRRGIFSLLFLLAILAAGDSRAQTSEAPPDIVTNWEDLLPPGLYDFMPKTLMSYEDYMKPEFQEKLIAADRKIRPVLDSKPIILPGYMVPLEYKGTDVYVFLLVPSAGQCIHVRRRRSTRPFMWRWKSRHGCGHMASR